MSAPPATLHDFAAALLPLPRSLTGDGVRATARAVADCLANDGIDLVITEVPTGTAVLDWTVPREWRLRRARLTGPDGAVVADTATNPLAVVGYSVPVDVEVDLAELDAHLHSLPDQPDATPYRTTYYSEAWGFCLPHRVRAALAPGRYHAQIDADFIDGALTLAEATLPGSEGGEVLVTAHTCHPGMANDNVSGIVVATALATALAHRPQRRHTYRFLYAPGTLGSLAWLATHRTDLDRIIGGLVLAGVGDRGTVSYKRTRRGDALVDRAVTTVLRDRGAAHTLLDFSPWGYDERQFNSPGFDLPVGLFMRTPHGTYPEYHTDGDNVGFITEESLADSVGVLLDVVDVLEHERRWRNLAPYGEPQLGRRGLYPSVGGHTAADLQLAQLWVLNQSDGEHGLLAIAERSGMPFAVLREAADRLAAAGLLEPAG